MKLADFLKQKKIRQTDFGDKIGCEQSHVSKLVNEEVAPTLQRAWEIEIATDGAVCLYDWLPADEVESVRAGKRVRAEAAA